MSIQMMNAVDQLDVIGVILRAIQKSELDCRTWNENSQKELAFEIGAAVNLIIEARNYERELYRRRE